MRARYAAIAAAPDEAARRRLVEPFLARLRRWMLETDPGPELRDRLSARLRALLGENPRYGVFVRSDTNVEDLPGFTGAGLNRTVPNVVGFENVVRAVQEVWASPFSERAFAWRQSHMERPEYVLASVVVQRAFPSEKSGVMVTADVDSGDPRWLSVAVGEGVGGAVEGQASESLRIPLLGGRTRFLSQATALERAELSPEGGIVRRPASGRETVLERDEVLALVDLAYRLYGFPGLTDASGARLPADVEFAFAGGRLALLQIRPFVESGRARESAFLRQLDAGLAAGGDAPVDLDAAPGGSAPPRPMPRPAAKAPAL
jgi:phosphoenolpyruvate synthase/pyruvate phosphate dikinase